MASESFTGQGHLCRDQHVFVFAGATVQEGWPCSCGAIKYHDQTGKQVANQIMRAINDATGALEDLSFEEWNKVEDRVANILKGNPPQGGHT